MMATRDGAHMLRIRRRRQQHDFTVGSRQVVTPLDPRIHLNVYVVVKPTPTLGSRQVVTPLDPRIHFALVCGAKSCPPIKVYTAEALEEGLEAAAAAFCESAPPRAELPYCL